MKATTLLLLAGGVLVLAALVRRREPIERAAPARLASPLQGSSSVTYSPAELRDLGYNKSRSEQIGRQIAQTIWDTWQRSDERIGVRPAPSYHPLLPESTESPAPHQRQWIPTRLSRLLRGKDKP